MDLTSPCAIPDVFAKHLTEETWPEQASAPAWQKPAQQGWKTPGEKSQKREFQPTKKCCPGLVPEFLFPKARSGWPRVPVPARLGPTTLPLRGELNSLPAGSLTLVCSEARNYKDLQEKKNPTWPPNCTQGPLGAAPSLCPHCSLGWAQPADRDGNLLKVLQSMWSSQDGISGCRATWQLHLLPKQGRTSSSGWGG